MANVIEFTIKGVDEFSNVMGKARSSINDVASSLRNAGDKSIKFGKTLSTRVTGPMALIGGSALALTNRFTEMGNTIAKTAKEAGLGGQEFQELSFALGQISQVTEGEVRRGFSNLNARLNEAREGNEGYRESLQKVGISLEDLDAGTVTTADALNAIIENTSQLRDQGEAASTTMKLMGERVGRTLGPALFEGGDAVAGLRDNFRELGLGMSNETLAATETLTDQMDIMKRQFSAVGVAVAAELIPVMSEKLIPAIQEHVIPALVSMAEMLASMIQTFSSFPEPVQKAIGVVAAAIGVGGPLLVALGFAAKAIAAVFVVATGPVGLAIAAAAALAAAWIAWGDDFKVLIREVIDWTTEKFTAFKEKVVETFQEIMDAPRKAWEGVKDRTSEAFESAKQATAEKVNQIKDETSRKFDELGQNVSESTKKMTETVSGWWQIASDRLVGNSIIPDMVDDISSEFDRLDEKVTDTSEGSTRIAENAFRSMRHTTQQVFSDVLTGAKSFSDGMKDAFKTMVTSLLHEFAKLLANKVFRWFMGSGGKASDIFSGGGGGGGGISGGGGGIDASGALASIGTTIGSFFGPVGGFLGGIAGKLFGGLFHGGMDYVPREGSYLLQQGERVLAPSQNKELMDFVRAQSHDQRMSGQEGGGITINNASFHFFENVSDPEAMLRMTREDWREIVARKMIPAMNDLNEAGVRPVAIERKRR